MLNNFDAFSNAHFADIDKSVICNLEIWRDLHRPRLSIIQPADSTADHPQLSSSDARYLERIKSIPARLARRTDKIELPGARSIDPERAIRQRVRLHRCRQIGRREYACGRIGRHAQKKCPDSVARFYGERLDAAAHYAATTQLVSDDGQVVDFSDVAQTPARKARLFWAHARGQQIFAERRGWIPLFVTATLPPEFHPAPAVGRRSWNGMLPWDSVRELQRRWKRVQDELYAANIRIFGVRVFEAHDDGCPHFHAVAYIRPEQLPRYCRAFRRVFGSAESACRFDLLTPERATKKGTEYASPASYALKYALKALGADPATWTKDDNRGERSHAYPRDGGWKYMTRCRTVQFFDVSGSSTLWRQVGRVKPGTPQHSELCETKLGARLSEAALNGRFEDFLETVLEIRSTADAVLKTLYSKRESGTTKIEGFELDVPDDPFEIEGFLFGGFAGLQRILTHLRSWTAQKKAQEFNGPLDCSEAQSEVSQVGPRDSEEFKKQKEIVRREQFKSFERALSEILKCGEHSRLMRSLSG